LDRLLFAGLAIVLAGFGLVAALEAWRRWSDNRKIRMHFHNWLAVTDAGRRALGRWGTGSNPESTLTWARVRWDLIARTPCLSDSV
jgi:hypothetical protein